MQNSLLNRESNIVRYSRPTRNSLRASEEKETRPVGVEGKKMYSGDFESGLKVKKPWKRG